MIAVFITEMVILFKLVVIIIIIIIIITIWLNGSLSLAAV